MNKRIKPAGLYVFLIGCLALDGCIGFDHRISQVNPIVVRTEAELVLYNAVKDSDPFTRSNAIEAMSQTLGEEGGSAYLQALADGDPSARFAAAMAVGDLKYYPARDRLLTMAGDKQLEPDKRVMCAVIYALHRLDNYQYTGQLGQLLFDQEKEVRANAALAMGKLGEPSAIGPLKSLLASELEPMVRLQIVESLALLGDQASALSLEGYTKTVFLDERLVAIPAMAKVNPQRASAVLRELLGAQHPPQVRVAAAGALASIGQTDDNIFSLAKRAASRPAEMLQKAYGPEKTATALEVHSLRRLSAIALGYTNKLAALDILQPLLTNEDKGVRLAAAMSVLRLVPASPKPPEVAREQAPTVQVDQPTADQPVQDDQPAEMPEDQNTEDLKIELLPQLETSGPKE